MKKVFLKWLGKNGENGLTNGKEYVFHKSPLSCEFVVNDSGTTLYTNGLQDYWQRIEREVFTAQGFEWFKHTPGEPMPCDGGAWIYTCLIGERLGYSGRRYKAEYASWHCSDGHESTIIGWRYDDSEQKEPEARTLTVTGLNQRALDGWEHVGDGWYSSPVQAADNLDIEIGAISINMDFNVTVADAAEFLNAQSFAGLAAIPSVKKSTPPITESDAADLFGFIHRSIAALNEPEPKPAVRCESSNLLIVAGDSVQLGGRFGGVSC